MADAKNAALKAALFSCQQSCIVWEAVKNDSRAKGVMHFSRTEATQKAWSSPTLQKHRRLT